MTKTTKYVLIGGVALVGAYVGLKWYQSTQAPSSSSGITGALSKFTQLAQGLSFGGTPTMSTTKVAARTTQTADGGGLPWGPGASDGYAAVSDATGYRQLHSYVPAQQSQLSDAQKSIAGIYS
jgi:hypothetical protein